VACPFQPEPVVGSEKRRLFVEFDDDDGDDDGDDDDDEDDGDDDEFLLSGDVDELFFQDMLTFVSIDALASVDRTETLNALSYALAKSTIDAFLIPDAGFSDDKGGEECAS
jgi:hypothetical protein